MFYKLFSVLMFVANLCMHEWMIEWMKRPKSLWRYLSTCVMSLLEMCGIGPVQCRSGLSLFQPTWRLNVVDRYLGLYVIRDQLFCASANLIAGEWRGRVRGALFWKFQALFCTWHHYKKKKKSPLLSPGSDVNLETDYVEGGIYAQYISQIPICLFAVILILM